MGALDNTVALVTGSSRGIGAAIARLFAREGALVAVHGRDVAALERVRREIEREGGRAIHLAGDVTRFSDVEAVRRNMEARLGLADLLVANAGGNVMPPHLAAEDITE